MHQSSSALGYTDHVLCRVSNCRGSIVNHFDSTVIVSDSVLLYYLYEVKRVHSSLSGQLSRVETHLIWPL